VREYQEVLRREKFSKYPDFTLRSENLLIDIESKGVFFRLKITLNVIGDLPDNRLSELAVESNADFLITGNSNDISFPNYGKTKIVNPKEYWELYK
jgi:putative PIN family toxin of toxin-antitoxin system